MVAAITAEEDKDRKLIAIQYRGHIKIRDYIVSEDTDLSESTPWE